MNYIWRLFATGISFITFGFGALFLTIFIFPPIVFLVPKKKLKKQIIQKVVSFSFRCFIYYMRTLGLFDLSLSNIERLKNDEGCIIIANHPTLIDVVLIISFCENTSCIVKKELWDNFFLRGVVKAAGYIPNDDPLKLVERAAQSIKNGDSMIIFPEGTRTRPNQPLEFKRGASHIAYALQCPIRFIRITCDPLTLSKGVPWYKIPPKKVKFTFEVLEKINTSEVATSDTLRPIAARRITDKFMSVYTSSLNNMNGFK